MVGVGIDNSSAKAEEAALDYAKKRAAYLVARKLGVKEADKQLAKLTEAQWHEIIRGATVLQTRRTQYTTYAEVNVTVVNQALYRALKLPEGFGKVATPEVTVRGVLLLNVYVGRDRPYLWEKENILREPLADAVRRQSHGAVLLPGGDFDDLRLIDYRNALTVTPAELKPMFERYGAKEIVIAVLTLSQPGTTDASTVLLRRLTPDNQQNELLTIPADSAEETRPARLNQAAATIAAAVTQIATSTAEPERLALAEAKTIAVAFYYAVPKELAKMQDIVRSAPQVLSLAMPSIALANVQGTIYLKGEAEALRTHLTKQGLVITSTGEGWRITPR